MGYGRFTAKAYTTYAASNNLQTSTREQVFHTRSLTNKLDPKNIILRESRDSDQNPKSVPIILGLDVTGSMGFVAEEIAKNSLPLLMNSIYEDSPVTDPHVMFMGIGDINCDSAPLQVSQFEAEAVPLIEQLRTLYLEGGGGGNDYESYDLPWYFANYRTSTDAFEKRGERGFIFTIGDELPPQRAADKHNLDRVFGSNSHIDSHSTADILSKVSERYRVFHIIAEQGSYCRKSRAKVIGQWKELLGPNAILMRDHSKLPEIITAILKIANGANIHEVIDASNCSADLTHAFTFALESTEENAAYAD